jgi:pimeloyl-ACP methyl ester carboxylesterase
MQQEGGFLMARQPKPTGLPEIVVRMRRAYFDCRFGQLHVRTAFPTTGGFDEQVTLFCLHGNGNSSRMFGGFLPLIADQRSVYAPDLPGCGESDPAPDLSVRDAASAVADLASDLRLRQIDLLGFQSGSKVCVELALTQPDLVRQLVLIGLPDDERLPRISQPCLVWAIGDEHAAPTRAHSALLRNLTFVEAPQFSADLFAASPQVLAPQFAAFLNRKRSPREPV